MQREMQAAFRELPWNELTPAAQARIRSVVSGSSLFHRMPQQKIYADPEIYQFLLRHPDMVIGFWEQLGATQLSLREVRENHYALRETGGTVATVEVLHRTANLCIVYARGEYRGPLISTAHQGEVILVLRTQYTRDEMNDPMIIADLDAFIQINSVGVDMLAKLFFAPLARVADSNFEVTMSFVSQVSRAASRNPDMLKDAAEEITSIRREVGAEFLDVVDRVAMRFARRNQPTPQPFVQQRTPSQSIAAQQPISVQPTAVQPIITQPITTQPRANHQDFAFSSRPPADWGMDHFFDTSQSQSNAPVLRFETPRPSYESVRFESTGELAAPRQIEPGRSVNAVPRLPRTDSRL